MTLFRILFREVWHSRLNTAFCLVAVSISVALLTAMAAVNRASVDATRVLMKDMGFNLLITPQGVDPARWQALDFQDVEMPEEYVTRLAKSTALARHYVGKYQKTIQVNGRTVVLTGVLPEARSGELQPMPTAYVIPAGRAFVGAAAARALNLKPNDSLAILGKSFVVDHVLPAAGMIPDDIRIYAPLRDVQAMLGRPGRINAIDALSCMCPTKERDVVAVLQRSVREILPDVEVAAYDSILLARHNQRGMMQTIAAVALAFVLAAAGLAVWGLTYLNVRNRRREIGVLRALGIAGWRIGALFVCKIAGYGLAGALVGYGLGVWLAVHFQVPESRVVAPADLLPILLAATPLAAALFGIGPIAIGLLQEPSDLLREE